MIAIYMITRFKRTRRPKEKTLCFIKLIYVRFILKFGVENRLPVLKNRKLRFFLEIFGIFWFFLHIMIKCGIRRR